MMASAADDDNDDAELLNTCPSVVVGWLVGLISCFFFPLLPSVQLKYIEHMFILSDESNPVVHIKRVTLAQECRSPVLICSYVRTEKKIIFKC